MRPPFAEENRTGPEERKAPDETERRLRDLLTEQMEAEQSLTDSEIQDTVDRLVLQESAALTLAQKEQMRKNLLYSVGKLDVLQELMEDPEITEVMVNGYQHIFYEKEGRITRWEKQFPSKERYEDVIQAIAGSCNRIVNEQRPIVDARLEDGSRVNIVLSPVALDGAVLTIRRFPEEPITMEKLIAMDSLTREAAAFLRKLVEARYSILVGGGTSTGKTTFLNALSGYIPSGERIVTIEDNAELQLRGIPNLVRLEARDANMDGCREITIRDLIRTALRMRPDRIIVGEVRGAEAVDFLISLNTGHDGSLGSAHANSSRDMIDRLISMVLMSGMELPVPVIRRQIVSGLDILIHLTRDGSGRRRVEEIVEITGLEQEEASLRKLFGRNQEDKLVQERELLGQEKLRHLEKKE